MSWTFQPLTLAAAQTQTHVPGYIRIWTGVAWVSRPIKYWNGSAWVQKPAKYWNGSSWVLK